MGIMHKTIIRLFILAVSTILLSFCKHTELLSTATKNFKASGGNPVIMHPLTADPSIHQWSDGKFYIYGSHDKDNAKYWNMADYHVFSSENMVDWTDHGVVLKKSQTRWMGHLWAPDAAEKDGMFYLYFPEGRHIGVAASTSPTGPFKKPRILYTKMKGRNSANDPCVFEDNGKWYLAYHYEVDGYYRRTTCIDSLFYNQDGTIQLVIPTKRGISPVIF